MAREPLDYEGNPLVDLDDQPLRTNPDGTLTLYHRTNKEGADAIAKTGRFLSKENTNETYFSNAMRGPNSVGYGDHVVEVQVHPRHTRLNDAFHKGEAHVAVSNKRLSRANVRRVFRDADDEEKIDVGKARGGSVKRRADRRH